MVLTEAEAEAKGVLFDQERVRQMEDILDQCAQVFLLINGGHVSARHAHALRYAVSRATDDDSTKIRVFARTEGDDTDPSLRELESEFKENPAVKWHGFADEILFDAAVSNHDRLTKSALTRIYRSKSIAAQKQGKWTAAIGYRKNAIELESVYTAPNVIAADHLFVGMRHIDLKEFSLAEDEISKALSLAEEAKATTLIIGAHEQLATVYLLSGDPARAEGRCLLAINMQEEHEKPASLAYLYRLLGKIYKAQMRFMDAETAWLKALSLSEAGSSVEGIKRTRLLLFELMVKQKRYSEALEYQKSAIQDVRKENNERELAPCLLSASGLYAFTGQVPAAKASLTEARSLFLKLENQDQLRRCDRMDKVLRLQHAVQALTKYRGFLVILLFALLVLEIFLRR
jgi:tetratricopeptide (TPR) repeat protein